MSNISCINFFVLLNTICGSLFVGYAKGTFPTIPAVDNKNPVEDLPLVGSALPLNTDVAPPPTVPPCCGCENSFQGFINSITNSKLFGSSGTDLKISACDNSDLFQLFGTCLEDREECDSSNYPYVLFLITINNKGQNKTVGQGVLLCDGSILTVYQCTQMGEGLWARFPCGALVKVKCMKQPKQCSSDLVEAVYTIKLILESSCCGCENHVYRPPVVTKECSSQSPFIEGYLVVQANVSKCSSEVYAISLKPALLLFDPTNVGFSLVLVAKPEDLCPSYQGALFIGKNGEVYGMAIYKVRVVNNVKNVSPYTKGLLSTLRCIIPIIKMDLLDDCNC